jgi:hypothetical protein
MGYLLKIILLHPIIPDPQRVFEYMPHTDREDCENDRREDLNSSPVLFD